MAMTATFTNFGGRILKENRGGTKRGYVPDPLGSTAALVDSSGAITDTWEYWPYGEVESHTGSSTTPFTFVGTLGYYRDTVSKLTYIRARFYASSIGQWASHDFEYRPGRPYQYTRRPAQIADASGLFDEKWCLAFCAPICAAEPPLCVECLSICSDASTIDEIRKKLAEIRKRRNHCEKPVSDTDCFLCPGKGGVGASKCEGCCDTLYGSDDQAQELERCQCWCDKYFSNPENNDCKPYPLPKIKKCGWESIWDLVHGSGGSTQ